jgi:hypothetical protein
MNTTVRALSVVGLAVLLGAQSGCLLVAAGAATGATVAYVSGDLNTTVDGDPKQVAAAAETALKKLEISIISAEASSVDSKVVGRTARDTRLIVTAKSSTAKLSELSIRAGRFGDDALQARLLEEIRAELKKTTVTGTPSTQPAFAGE